MKKGVCVYLALLAALCVYAHKNQPVQEEYPWLLFEQGKAAYEKREFGEALTLFEKAREIHKTQMTKQYDYLISALKSYEVKAAGDRISDVYRVLEKRQDYGACKILDSIFLNNPPSYFDRSMSALLAWFAKRFIYPECDYMIGKVYELEGELTQARSFYQTAWEAREFLYIPDMRFEIIYSLANISGLLQQYDDKEKYLLLILTEDEVYGTTNVESATLRSMMHTIKHAQTVEKFFSLYRHRNDTALRAYIELTALYLNAKEYDRAFRTALLGSSIAVTYLSETLKRIDFTYSYSDFSDLLRRVGTDADVLRLTETKQIWDVLLQFAHLLYRQGYAAQATDLYRKIAESCPSLTAAREATYQLSQML